jgi:hypothetical protein
MLSVSDILFYIIFIFVIVFLCIKKYSKKHHGIIFIVFIVIFWISFLSVNPYNFKDNNKYNILKYIPSQYKPKTILFTRSNLNQIFHMKYPLILKPTICTRNGSGIKKINSFQEITKYIDNKNFKDYLVQEYIDTEYEVGLLYERNPLKSTGSIISIVEVKQLGDNFIRNDDKNNGINYNHKKEYDRVFNRSDWISLKLTETIDTISKKIPNFYVGRYDIKFSNINDFIKGKNFYILEANGTMGFDQRKKCYSRNFFLNFIYGIPDSIRWITIRLLYGLINILTLKTYSIIDFPTVMLHTLKNTYKCGDWEKIFSYYT